MSKAELLLGAVEAAEYVAGAVARGLGKVKPESEKLFEAARVLPPVKSGESILQASADKFVESGSVDSLDGKLSHILQRAKETNSDSLLLSRGGKTLLDWQANGQSVELPANSVTKSLTNLAVGKLVGEGKISSTSRSFPRKNWSAFGKSPTKSINSIQMTSGSFPVW